MTTYVVAHYGNSNYHHFTFIPSLLVIRMVKLLYNYVGQKCLFTSRYIFIYKIAKDPYLYHKQGQELYTYKEPRGPCFFIKREEMLSEHVNLSEKYEVGTIYIRKDFFK